jgi:hypothetical protein
MWWPCSPAEFAEFGVTGQARVYDGYPLTAFRLRDVRGLRSVFRAAARADGADIPE